MSSIAVTPEPPYYAVIFTNLQTDDLEGYEATAERMVMLAAGREGFLGVESARDGLGITVSYWRDLESIRAWKADAEHQLAQGAGRERWYAAYKARIARVERDYGFSRG
jgi:heme-degrading monooxygenase HmoA